MVDWFNVTNAVVNFTLKFAEAMSTLWNEIESLGGFTLNLLVDMPQLTCTYM